MGPRNSEINHQLSPLLPLACANPALMSDKVNHPTAYSPVFEFMFTVVVFVSSLLAQAGEHVDYKGPESLDWVPRRAGLPAQNCPGG
jgi:hypothetical protein